MSVNARRMFALLEIEYLAHGGYERKSCGDKQTIQDMTQDRKDRVRSERDHPLSFHWRPLSQCFIDQLGLPGPRNALHAQARASIMTEAYIRSCGEPETWISYSRRRDFYTNQQRYRGTAYTYNSVVAEIDLLASFGLIENIVTPPGGRGWQSRFRATLELLNTADQPVLAVYHPYESIRLKDRDGKLIGYRDTAETISMRQQLAEFNEAIAKTEIALRAPGVIQEENVIRCGLHVLYPGRGSYYRVFNGSWRRGGRMYGPWWQNARSKDRAYIEINSEPVIELDYPAHHLRMAYAISHAVPPPDPYTIPGWDRPVVKSAVLIMFNGEDDRGAVGAIANLIGGENSRLRATHLIRAVKDKHLAVAHLFHTDLGVRLQRRDADMATDITWRLLKRGVITLAVHDSFIVAMRYGGELYEAMTAAWRQFLDSVDSPVKAATYRKLIPHMGREGRGGGGGGLHGLMLPLLVLVLPALSQLDLFEGSSCASVPLKELDGWRRGFSPPSVRRAIDHEIRRRGILRVDLARRLGVSKQQLTNVLHGRFGASDMLARGLIEFVKEGGSVRSP